MIKQIKRNEQILTNNGINFSLRKVQEQKYYKKINYLPIRENNIRI